jgi:hypothetical protein
MMRIMNSGSNPGRLMECDHKTATAVRRELEETGQIDQFEAKGDQGVTTALRTVILALKRKRSVLLPKRLVDKCARSAPHPPLLTTGRSIFEPR